MESSSVNAKIAAEAADWLITLQSEGDEAHRVAFTEWLMQSPAHIDAYLSVSRTWDGLKIPAAEGPWSAEALIAAARADGEIGNVVRLPVIEAIKGPQAPPYRAPVRWPLGVAAGLLMTLMVAWVFQAHPSVDDLKTSVGEQRSVTLADGSVVYLNTNSELEVRWTQAERHIDLKRGEARFQVAKNPARPFVVATREATVKAVGTVFNVRTGEDTTQVAVLEGRVDVHAIGAGAPTEPFASELLLAAGERAAVTPSGVQPGVGPPIERVATWTDRRLVFRGEPLSAVVAEFNRYRNEALVVDDAGLAQIRINGVFDLNDPDSLVAYLRGFESVQVKKDANGSEHLTRGVR